jgi:hypothetical protein
MSKLHLVFGGRVKDPRGLEFEDPDALHIVGIYPDYASAEAAWRGALEAVTLADVLGQVGAQSSPEHLTKSMAWLGEQVVEIGGG